MKLLLIDTTTERSQIAFTQNDRIHFSFELPFGAKSSERLAEEMASRFQACGESLHHLDCIGVASGPGSFIGTRVGVATAMGLAAALDAPLVSFCSLLSYVPEEDGRFVSLIDARVGGAYALFQEKKGGLITPLSEPHLLSKEEFNHLPLAVGPSLRRLELSHFVERSPDIDVMREVVTKKYLNQELGCELLYLRETV